jgi:hypothetical protein
MTAETCPNCGTSANDHLRIYTYPINGNTYACHSKPETGKITICPPAPKAKNKNRMPSDDDITNPNARPQKPTPETTPKNSPKKNPAA